MSTNPIARRVLSTLGALLLAVVLFIAWTLWDLRPRTVRLEAPPFALRDDAAALALAHTALQKVGYDPTVFAPPSRSPRYDSAPELQRFTFFSTSTNGSTDHPGVHVRLEQQGTAVVCFVARKK